MLKFIINNLIWREGKSIIFVFIILFFFSIYFKYTFLIFLLLIFFLFSFYFFRNPQRIILNPLNFELDDIIISPADGVVIEIVELDQTDKDIKLEDGYLKRVSIFLSPFDVHVNWASMAGNIEAVEYKKGEFRMAFTPKSSILNERNDILIRSIVDSRKKILIRQIAGTIARKIVCWVKVNDYVKLGQKYGMIKFGSRVDIFFTDKVELKVNLNDRVYGGQTIIAKWLY